MSDSPIFDNIENDRKTPIYDAVVNGDEPVAEVVVTPIQVIDNTPNVVISNPHVRRYARIVLDTVGAALLLTVIVDSAVDAFNILFLTAPTATILYGVRTMFGFAVDTPNTPK